MTIGFEQIVDTVRSLSFEQQELLQELITQWHNEEQRAEIATDAQESLAMFRAGQLKAQSAQDVIAELRQCLDREE